VPASLSGVKQIAAGEFFSLALDAADPAQSLVSVSAPSVTYGSTATVTLQVKDSSGANLSSGGLNVAFALGAGTSSGSLSAVTDHHDGTYTATFTATAVGTARTLTATLNGAAITTTLPSVTVTKASLTVTADADANAANGQTAFSKTYGTLLSFAGTEFTASGLVNGDAVTKVTLSSDGAAAGASVAGAPYQVLISNAVGTGLSNYTIHYAYGTLSVNPASLSATNVNFSATAGAPFSGTVATFTTPETVDGAKAFTATLTWEDGSTSSGGITAIMGSPGSFSVSGSHTFAAAGTFTTISVHISNPNTQSATATDTASVTSLGQGVTKGLTGGIGFWHGPQGQALINNFNVTPSNPHPTTLAGWLKATFANLYGGLALTSNADVAAYFQTLFNQAAKATGTKTQVQAAQAAVDVLATALNVYATTSAWGGSAAAAYGFTVSSTGLGACSYSVGSDGAAVGVPNSTTLTVYGLLQAVNRKAVNGLLYNGDVTLEAEAADLFDGLNQAGSIG
jgi:hypothetical protein